MVSVIIPTLNREQELCDAIRYFLERETYQPFELIIIDQSDSHEPETINFLSSVDGRIKYVRVNYKNQPKAINQGVGLARGDTVVFVDDDVEPKEGFLAAHIAPYFDSRIMAVTGPILKPGESSRSRGDIGEETYNALLRKDIMMFNVDFGFFVSWSCGTNISFRKEFFERIGGFDENFYGMVPIGHDTEICPRVKKAGGLIYYTPHACLIHKMAPGGGCRTITNQKERIRLLVFNKCYLWWKLDIFGLRWCSMIYGLFRGEALNKKTLRQGKFVSLSICFIRALLESNRRIRHLSG